MPEARQLMSRHGITLSAASLAHLTESSEGWAAGLTRRGGRGPIPHWTPGSRSAGRGWQPETCGKPGAPSLPPSTPQAAKRRRASGWRPG
jgi:hypothetical protein